MSNTKLPATHLILDWLREREANARRLANLRDDKAGWLEDAEYFGAAAKIVWDSLAAPKADRERQAGEAVAWRWKERDHFFNWTTDWSHHDKAKAMGCEIEYALASLPALQAVQAGWKLLKDTTHDERSWSEDSAHENGCYSCCCMECGRMFTGHKRRVVCKSCADAPTPKPNTATRWLNVESAMEDPLFQQARAIMGTNTWFQDNALRNVINYVLSAPSPDGKAEQAEAPSEREHMIGGRDLTKAVEAPRNIIWDPLHPDYPVEWSNPGRPAREGEVHYIRHDIYAEAVHAAHSPASGVVEREAPSEVSIFSLALDALQSVEWHGGGSCWVVDADKVDAAIKALKDHGLAHPSYDEMWDALMFYAEPKNWESYENEFGNTVDHGSVGQDEGDRARSVMWDDSQHPWVPRRKPEIKNLVRESLATQPTASNAGERELIAEALKIQSDAFGNGTKLHLAMIGWADKARAALASKPPAGEQKPVGEMVAANMVGPNDGGKHLQLFVDLPVGALVYTSQQPEQVAQDREHAENYRLIRRGQHWSVVDGIGNTLRGEDLDAAVDAIRAARAARARGEGQS